ELGSVTGRFGPAPDALAREFGAHAEHRANAETLRRFDREIDLLETFEDDDDALVEALREQRRFDVGAVLVTVADDQTAAPHRRQCDQKFRFGARFETVVELLAELDDVRDEMMLLVDLDREDTLIAILVAVLGDGLSE